MIVEAQAFAPLGGLRDRFGAGATGAVGYGWSVGAGRTLEVRAQAYPFRKGTVSLADTTAGAAPVSADSLRFSLDLAGGSVVFRQSFSDGRVRPFVHVGGGFYRWVERRGAYPGAGVALAARRAQWSGALHAGAGAEAPLGRRLAVRATGTLSLSPGNLYGASNLRLREVTAFQWATAAVSLSYGF